MNQRAPVSPWSPEFILGTISALSHVVFILFHFRKQNEIQKN